MSTSIVKSGSANEYSSGTIVEVTAAPLAGWTFDKWSGAISGTVNPQQVTIDSDKTVIAEYKSLAPIVLDNDGITFQQNPILLLERHMKSMAQPTRSLTMIC